MTADANVTSLDAIRREIDSIDDQILDLLLQRFAATEKVKARKSHDGSIASSPFRPAREAEVMQRLIDRAGSKLDPQILLRLWRVIFAASIQSQAHVTLHMDAALGADPANRLLATQHFPGMRIELHPGPSAALAVLAEAQGDLALVAPGSDWARHFTAGSAGGAQVIVTLPVITGGQAPEILVLGHALPQPTGNDETLVILPEGGVSLPGVLWEARSGAASVAGLSGFLDEGFASLPGIRIAGRYPRPIKVSS